MPRLGSCAGQTEVCSGWQQLKDEVGGGTPEFTHQCLGKVSQAVKDKVFDG